MATLDTHHEPQPHPTLSPDYHERPLPPVVQKPAEPESHPDSAPDSPPPLPE